MWRPLAQKYCIENTEKFGIPWATARLFTALSLSPRNVSCGCPPTVNSTSPLKTPSQLVNVFQPIPYCSEAQTSLLCRAVCSQSFAREGKKKKMWRSAVFGCCPDHLSVMFQPQTLCTPSLVNIETPSPLVIQRENPSRCKQTVCMCVCVYVCQSEVRDYNKAGYHSDHTFITSRVSVLVKLGNKGEARRS